MCFNCPLLPESVCVQLAAGVFDCRLSGELIGSSLEARGIKAGSSQFLWALLSQSDCQHGCLCSRCAFFLMKTFYKCFAAGGAWGMGRGESHVHVVPGFPLGPGHNKDLC